MKAAKKFSFYQIFGSHMVLQRQRPIVFSGTADAEHLVKVTFAGQTVTAAADADGVWRAAFPAREAGGPFCAELAGDPATPAVKQEDILIGDVWMCSGQSNMEMPLWSDTPFWRSTAGDETAASATLPQLRLFNSTLERRESPNIPLADENGPGWECCTPDNVKSFSACGFYFGRKLLQDLNVPIGLISTAVGGTDIEAWISREKYEQEQCVNFLRMRDRLADPGENFSLNFEKNLQNWFRHYNSCRDAYKHEYTVWLRPDYDDSAWKNDPDLFRIKEPGTKIFRCSFDATEEFIGKELTLSLGVLNDVDETYLNGILIGKTDVDVPNYWGAQRNYDIPANILKASRNVLAIINDNHYCSGGFSPAHPVALTEKENPGKQLVLTQWRARTAFVADLGDLGPRPTVGWTTQNIPCTLFNGMMHPWFKYAVRGVIWYQGCNNNGRRDYYVHHRYLIEDWRKQWHDPKLPFFLVQLAGFAEFCPEHRKDEAQWQQQEPEENPPYPLTREIQAEMPKLYSNVGMAVAMDVGDQYDIHPADKKTLGYRLACEAERIAYGMPLVSQGPEFDHFVVENGKARVFFKHTEGGLRTCDGKKCGAFALGGKDGKLHWAEAEIDGDSILVSTPAVTEPVRVRYAYAGYRGDCNLMNDAGFPAVPFRSDKDDYTKEVVR